MNKVQSSCTTDNIHVTLRLNDRTNAWGTGIAWTAGGVQGYRKYS